MATELSDFFQAAGIHPPYVVVAHSYGIIARGFLAPRPSDVCGMVLIDTNSERSPQIPHDEFVAMMNGLEYFAVAVYEASHKFTAEEWESIKNPASDGAATADAETQLAENSYVNLGEKLQYDSQALRSKPLSLIKGQTDAIFASSMMLELQKGT